MAEGKVKLPEDRRLRKAVEEWIYNDLGPDLDEVDEEEGEFDLPKDRQTAEVAADFLERVVQVLRVEAPNLPEMEEEEEEEPEADKPFGHDEADGIGTDEPEAEEAPTSLDLGEIKG